MPRVMPTNAHASLIHSTQQHEPLAELFLPEVIITEPRIDGDGKCTCGFRQHMAVHLLFAVTFSRSSIVNIFWPLEDPLWAFLLQNCVQPFSSAHMKAYACSCVPPHAPASRYLDDAGDHSCHVQLLPSCIILCMTRLPACLCGYKCLRLICNAISLHPCHADRMTTYALFPLFHA
jgi:hypothetical protein